MAFLWWMPIKADIVVGRKYVSESKTSMPTDPWFYVVCIPAVLLFGIAKGGFGGGLGVASVPLMALVMSPVQAASVLLPILCLMDLLSLWAYRGQWVWQELRILIPASLLGVTAGTLLFSILSAAIIKIVIGSVALLFTLHYWLNKYQKTQRAELQPLAKGYGVVGGSVAGFTSFVAHAGGPPVSMYLLRRPLDRTGFVATTVVFFAIVNYVKLLPYAWLGQLPLENLKLSLVLAPLAPIGVALGVYMHRKVSEEFFFRFMYVLLFIVALKLIYDGVVAT